MWAAHFIFNVPIEQKFLMFSIRVHMETPVEEP